jgi:8-amino-7-oxononanoate synthase
MQLPQKLITKLDIREQEKALRQLLLASKNIDFCSNDYLGFAKSETIFANTHAFLTHKKWFQNGATGSRLLSGNHPIHEETETCIAAFHQSETALLFNSGYDANVGFFATIPQKGDVVLYDAFCHASIRDGIAMSHAKSYKFKHNDLAHLEKKINQFQTKNHNIYIATETVFSMDGDSPDLQKLTQLATKYNALLILDEAHALGVFGENGAGLTQSLQLQAAVFARIVTFGKGLGCHGAAVLGSKALKTYLINFARSFIYTTALSPHSVATILMAYQALKEAAQTSKLLQNNITCFNEQKVILGLEQFFVPSQSAIQSAIIPGNENVKNIAQMLHANGFDVKAILSPTVPLQQERLRFCLHSYNSKTDILRILNLLKNNLKWQ